MHNGINLPASTPLVSQEWGAILLGVSGICHSLPDIHHIAWHTPWSLQTCCYPSTLLHTFPIVLSCPRCPPVKSSEHTVLSYWKKFTAHVTSHYVNTNIGVLVHLGLYYQDVPVADEWHDLKILAFSSSIAIHNFHLPLSSSVSCCSFFQSYLLWSSCPFSIL